MLYLNWSPFEDFQIDDALRHLESRPPIEELPSAENERPHTSQSDIEAFRDKVGLTAVVDLAFIDAGCVHIYQRTTDWFDSFEELTDGLGESENGAGVHRSRSDCYSKTAL